MAKHTITIEFGNGSKKTFSVISVTENRPIKRPVFYFRKTQTLPVN